MNTGKILTVLLALILASVAQAATGSKTIVDDTGVSAAVSTDIFPAVIDPGGTPLSRKITLGQAWTANRTNSAFKGSTTFDDVTAANITNSTAFYGAAATLSGALDVGGAITHTGGTASRFVSLNGSKVEAFSAASSVLAASLSDETGSGAAVFGTAPSVTGLVTDTLRITGATASRFAVLDASKDVAVTATSAVLAATLSDEVGSGKFLLDTSPVATNFTAAPGGYFSLGFATATVRDEATNHWADFNAGAFQLITATNAVHLIPTNTSAGKVLVIVIDSNAGSRTVSLASSLPQTGTTNGQATLPSGSYARVTFTGFGGNNTNAVATYEAFARP